MVILQGRSFLCQMMNLLCAFRPYDHLICLNQEFFLDLARKQEVFQSWNGCSFLQYLQWTLLADFEVSSDASGALGYGAVVQGHWFSGASLAKQVSQSIEYKHGEAPFPYGRGSLPQGSPYGPSNGSTSGNSAVWYFKSPLPSCPRFAVCPYWQLIFPSLSLRPQLEGSLARSIPVLLSVSALSPVSPSCRLRSNPDPQQLLLDKCHFYLNKGLAPSTRKVYASAEPRFLDFYAQDNSLYLFGGQLFQPVKKCSSISAVILPIISRPFIHCLSAIRSLHIKEGLPSPLVGCLRLQRVFRRIKRHQGSNKGQCEPITIELMYIIFQSLNFSDYSHTMLWAACCLGCFGFLRASEFTVNLFLNPDIHLAVSDV